MILKFNKCLIGSRINFVLRGESFTFENKKIPNMRKIELVPLALILLLTACVETGRKQNPETSAVPTNGLQLLTEPNPEWQFENLRLYPVIADETTVRANQDLASWKTLAEGMETPGFRITELKQFGRTQERTFNALTVQNKGRDTIFMMSGDVVTGGNQDRVIAYDDIIPPGTIKNIEVFCVEKGRWQFKDTTATESERAVYAFCGYYHVASPEVRHAVQRTGNQHEVWSAVARVTSANNAGSGTDAYTALDTENEFKTRRDAYLRFFAGKLTNLPNVVGMVAVCNGKVAGVDIFGHPALFSRQYESLLHGYATEAVTSPSTTALSEAEARFRFQAVARLADPDTRSNAEAGKYMRQENWIHLFLK